METDEKANGAPPMDVDEPVSVRDRPYRSFRPLSFFSLSLPQTKPLPPSICRIWVMMSKSLESSHGNSLAGKSSRKSLPVQSLSVAATAGVYLPRLFLCIPSLPLERRRRILLFPFGNSNAPPNDTVSVYLDYADPKRAPEGWHACAQFALVVSNPHDPTIYTVSRTCLADIRDHGLICLWPSSRCTPPLHRRGM